MKPASEEAVEHLLEETFAAHSVYETTVLGGAHDERWSEWYATYLLEHGLQDLISPTDTMGTAQLASILRQLDGDYRREQPEGDWPAHYAGRLNSAVGVFQRTGGSLPPGSASLPAQASGGRPLE